MKKLLTLALVAALIPATAVFAAGPAAPKKEGH